MDGKGIRIAAALLGLLVVGFAFFASRGGDGSGGGGDARRADGGGSGGGKVVEVTVAYSPEKEAVFKRAFADFNSKEIEVDGYRVRAVGEVVSSGKSFDRLRTGDLKPVIWSPSSSMWGRLLTHTADVPWVPEDSASFARTPLVIAIWEAQAQALGWPKKQLGWADVVQLAQDPQGFSRYGHPEWGRFRLGQTNPDFSTSGLSATVAEYYAVAGKTEGLTEQDLANPKVRASVRAIQSSIVHYGDTTLFFAKQMAERGPSYASAVAMEETTLLDFNTNLRKGGPRLVAIYPKEGTFFSDNPLIVLEGDWVSKREREAAAELVEYLRSETVQKRVGKFGFRPGSDDVAIDTRSLSKANGIDVAEPKRRMSLPSPAVLARVKELWHEDRKPADVVIVLDTSGSMLEEQRLIQAQDGLTRFVKLFGPRDRAALVTFADEPRTVRPLTVMSGGARAELSRTIEGLFAEGGTSVYDATLMGVELLRKSGKPDHIQAVVVLTDGLDNKSNTTLDELVQRIEVEEAAAGREPVRVFTIAYGSDASIEDMRRIAESTAGQAYTGEPENIDSVYTSISSFF